MKELRDLKDLTVHGVQPVIDEKAAGREWQVDELVAGKRENLY